MRGSPLGVQPFNVLEIDLIQETFTNQMFEISGKYFAVLSKLIPVGRTVASPTLQNPTIKFNDISSNAIVLNPFSVFRCDFDRVFINSKQLETNSNNDIADYGLTTILYSNINDTFLWNLNFKEKLGFGNSTGYNVGTNENYNIPVPIGAEKAGVCVETITASGAIAITLYGVKTYGSNAMQEILFTESLTGSDEIVMETDVKIYDMLFLNVNGLGETGTYKYLVEFF